ncbi:MAG: hypothetical protein ACTH0Y_07205 [Luteimonas sp.]
MTGIAALPGQGPWQRFIMKFRAGSTPARDPDSAREWLQRRSVGSGTTDEGGKALQLAWQRRLGTGADLVLADRALDRDAAGRLLEVLAAEPEVEYVEADAMMQAFTQPAGPPARP